MQFRMTGIGKDCAAPGSQVQPRVLRRVVRPDCIAWAEPVALPEKTDIRALLLVSERKRMNARPRTFGELKASEYPAFTVRDEMRKNLIRKLKSGEKIFPWLQGFEDTVVPQLVHAVLAGHDIILLGERGQAKSRILRALPTLLDDEIPVVKGSEINDSPFAPISLEARERLARDGDRTEIEWIGRDRRYGEKLATPDVSTADLIGEIDPVKVAEGRYLADERTIHYGIIPRTNRGIFAINELPDLPEKVQVALFNVLEERDFQIKGYRIRLPLDIMVVATANPEDYTNRGRIITPLKDRYESLVRTHYPLDRETEAAIIEAEQSRPVIGAMRASVPRYLLDIVAEFSRQAREHPAVDQRSGVSVRLSIANYETLVAAAEKRALLLGEEAAVPRISDLDNLAASSLGKLEFEMRGDDGDPMELFRKILGKAVLRVFGEWFELEQLHEVIAAFRQGWGVEVGETMPSADYVQGLDEIKGLRAAVEKAGAVASGEIAAAVEFIFEGLHLSGKLNKEVSEKGTTVYR